MIPRYTRPLLGALWEPEAVVDSWWRIELLLLEAWSREGVVPPEAVRAIRRRARLDVARIREIEKTTRHEILAFLRQVGETLGPYARYLHRGVTSSDILDTQLALHLRAASRILRDDLQALLAVLRDRAFKHKDTVMIGRTHGMHAEPTTFGLTCAVWYDEMRRNLARLRFAEEMMAYGKMAGAVGTYAHVPPRVEAFVLRRLGLKVAPAVTQVIPRDRHAFFVATLAVLAASVEKIAVDLRHLQRTEVAEVEEAFGSGQMGSSAMPHKRNPITAENLSGLARLLRGYAVAALEDVALWHERDISHSSVERVILPDATIVVDHLLTRLTALLETLVVHEARMRAHLEKSGALVYSERLLLALMDAGLPRDEAYALVQRPALRARSGAAFAAAVRRDARIRRHLSARRLAACLSLADSLSHVETIFTRVFPKGERL